MSKKIKLITILLLAVVGLLTAGFVVDSWLDQEDDRLLNLSNDQLQVVATIFPLADMAQQIIGNEGVVTQLIPNSADPHTYSPSPEDILHLSQADVLIFLGEEKEPWVQSMLSGVENPNLHVIDLSQLNSESGEADRLEDDEEGLGDDDSDHSHEFHYWLDFELARQAVQMIALELSKAAPDLTEKLSENSQKEQARWAELDDKYRLGLINCQTRTVVYAGHSAFGHVAEEYELSWLDALTVSPDAELAPQTLASMIQTLQREKSLAVFTDVFFSPKLAETIAEESGLPVLRLNPGERWRYENGQYQAGGLMGIMEMNLEKLQEGLGCE